jgi:hypothetical protein
MSIILFETCRGLYYTHIIKNKELVHQVGDWLWLYHDARSAKHKKIITGDESYDRPWDEAAVVSVEDYNFTATEESTNSEQYQINIDFFIEI